MSALHSPSNIQNPPQTFLDKKPPLLPRQSTSDVLSFTHIIANRLSPGQSVWDFFSPPKQTETPAPTPLPRPSTSTDETVGSSSASRAGLPPLSPAATSPTVNHSPSSPPSTSPCLSPRPSSGSAESLFSSTLPELPPSGQQHHFNTGSRRQSLAVDVRQVQQHHHQEINTSSNDTLCQTDADLSPSSITPSSPTPCSLPMAPPTPAVAAVHPTSTDCTSTSATGVVAAVDKPKLQKRRSFAQSLKKSMISFTQLLSPVSSRTSNPNTATTASNNTTMTTAMEAMAEGPPHYNILVLGSDSAPLASTLYKMSGLLPGTTKIRHYQEISGFFVAYFESNDSSSCTPKVSTDVEAASTQQQKQEKVKGDAPRLEISQDGADEATSRRQSSQESDDDEQDRGFWGRSSIETATGDDVVSLGRSSEETLLQLKPSFTQSTIVGSTYSSTANSVKDTEECEEVLLSDTEKEDVEDDISQEIKATLADCRSMPVESYEPCSHGKHTLQSQTAATAVSVGPQGSELTTTEEEERVNLNPSANASLSIHAFSLDTTWPVPRILAQTFWFPFAHGIIYVVDATRKNDPRGVDHLLNARQFLASLVADPHFRRRDIPVVVFANKAGTDPETCYRLDEIAEILGCEDWDMNGSGGSEMDTKTGKMKTRPWCVKSTRSDGEGEGIRESVVWLKSRMGEVWMP